MKQKLLLTTFLLTITTFLFGQNFGSIGTQWYYSEHAGGAAPPNSEYLHLQSVADTVIDDVTTHKIVRTYYKFNGDTVTFDPIFVYEQSDTAFSYNFQMARFQAIYIFNAQQGDTLTLDFPEPLPSETDSTYRLVIDTVETVIIDGISLKKYRTIALDEFQFYNGGYFMDRIGGLDWFFPRAVIIPEAGGPIRCYSDDQIDTSFQLIACDYRLVTSINEVSTTTQINVFPNPVQNKLTIQSEQPIETVELKDLTGKILIKTSQLNLNCEQISNGVYILTVYFKSGQKLEKKIIKNAL
ncbi:MAG: T9SS type A sorting domain-containing protein [Chitinophagales bacterium]